MGGLDRHEQELVVAALSRLLATPAGQALLESAAPYLSAACASATSALRRLAVTQLYCIVNKQMRQQAGSTGREAVVPLLEQLAVMLTVSPPDRLAVRKTVSEYIVLCVLVKVGLCYLSNTSFTSAGMPVAM
jgi:hypothetical protein